MRNASFVALTCPQCGGTLPRTALWRTVACPYCAAQVTRGVETVRRADFRAAWLRSRETAGEPGPVLHVGERPYRLLAPLGEGEHATAWLGRALGTPTALVTIKLARAATSPLPGEASVLRRLAAIDGAGAAYFSQRLPQLEHAGPARTAAGAEPRDALVLRHQPGFDAGLADVLRRHPDGLRDARHVVWLWRRVLEVLGFLHDNGWTHRDLQPAHWLVHARDHGVALVGWGRARPDRDVARDLVQSAWVVRSLLAGERDAAPAIPAHVPAPLAEVVRLASEDAAACRRLGARGLDERLVAAARAAFGRPSFVPFDPANA